MLVKKNIACHIVHKVLFQIQNEPTGFLKNMILTLNYNSQFCNLPDHIGISGFELLGPWALNVLYVNDLYYIYMPHGPIILV